MNVIFEKLNLLPHRIGVYYKSKSEYPTIFGLIFSCAFYVIFAYCCYFFSWDFLSGKNPQISYTQNTIDKNLTKNLSELVGNIQINGYLNAIVKKDNYTLENLLKKEFANELISIFILIKEFDKPAYLFYSGDFHVDSFIQLPKNNFDPWTYEYEIKYSFKVSEKTIFQNYNEQNFTYDSITFQPSNIENIHFGVYYAQSLSKKIEYQDFFSKFAFSNNLLDFDNANSSKSINEDYVSGMQFYREKKKIVVIYGIVEVKKDVGYIFSKIEKNVFYEIKRTHLDYETPVELFKTLASVNIKFERYISSYNRIYKKIQNVLADLGGLFNAFLVIGNLMVNELNKKAFDLDIINRLYGFDSNYKCKIEQRRGNVLKRQKLDEFFKLSSTGSHRRNMVDSSLVGSKSNSITNNFDNKNGIENDCHKVKENIKGKNNKDYKRHTFFSEMYKSKFTSTAEGCDKLQNNFNFNMNKKNYNTIFEKEKNSNTSDINFKNIKPKSDSVFISNIRYNANENMNKIIDLSEINEIKTTKKNIDNTDNNNKTNDLSNCNETSDRMRINKNSFDTKRESDFSYNINQAKAESPGSAHDMSLFNDKINEFLTKVKNKQNVKTLMYSNLEIFRSIFCFEKFKDQKLIKKDLFFYCVENKIYSFMDIFNIIKHFEMFEIMKKLVFNKQQNQCFDFIKIQFNNLEEENNDLNKKLLELKQYFTFKDIEEDSNELALSRLYDDKFTELLDKPIQNLLEVY